MHNVSQKRRERSTSLGSPGHNVALIGQKLGSFLSTTASLSRLLPGLAVGTYCAQFEAFSAGFCRPFFPSLSFLAMSTVPAFLSTVHDRIERLSSLSGSFYTVSPDRYIGGCNIWESYSPLEEEELSFSSLEATAGRHCGFSKLSPFETFQRFCEKKLHNVVALVFCPDYCQGSDYGGSLVELSNCDVLAEEHYGKGVWRLYGGHSSFGLAFDVRFLTQEVIESLEALEHYPLASEDRLSELELEKEQEAWESWTSSDFTEELLKLLSSFYQEASEDKLESLEDKLESLEDKLESLEDEKLYGLFYEARELGNHHWETEHQDRWIDCERVAASVSFSSLLEALA
jgi:hypothetical protein